MQTLGIIALLQITIMQHTFFCSVIWATTSIHNIIKATHLNFALTFNWSILSFNAFAGLMDDRFKVMMLFSGLFVASLL